MNILKYFFDLFKKGVTKPNPRFPNAYEPGKGGILYDKRLRWLTHEELEELQSLSGGISLIDKATGRVISTLTKEEIRYICVQDDECNDQTNTTGSFMGSS
jgi:hypothetical protein